MSSLILRMIGAWRAWSPTTARLVEYWFFRESKVDASAREEARGHSTKTFFPARREGDMVERCRSTRTAQTTRSMDESFASSILFLVS